MQINNFININQATDQFLNGGKTTSDKITGQGVSFADILNSKSSEKTSTDMVLKFSKHAASRLEDRNITMTDEQIERLSEGTARAQQKGIKDSLVMVDSLAFIVNIPNQTVVTAMDQTETNENIFTNIDGAVIA